MESLASSCAAVVDNLGRLERCGAEAVPGQPHCIAHLRTRERDDAGIGDDR